MVTKDTTLYVRFRKRAAEISGTSPEPKKKARLSGPETSAAQVGPSRPAAQVGPSRPAQEVPSTDHRGSGSAEASAMLACPVPISQRRGRHPVSRGARLPSSDARILSQGAARVLRGRPRPHRVQRGRVFHAPQRPILSRRGGLTSPRGRFLRATRPLTILPWRGKFFTSRCSRPTRPRSGRRATTAS